MGPIMWSSGRRRPPELQVSETEELCPIEKDLLCSLGIETEREEQRSLIKWGLAALASWNPEGIIRTEGLGRAEKRRPITDSMAVRNIACIQIHWSYIIIIKYSSFRD